MEETRSLHKGKIELVDLGGVKVTRVTHEPGWRWSECVKPIVGTDSCQVGHLIHVTLGADSGPNGRRIRSRVWSGRCGVDSSGARRVGLGDEPFISIDF